MTASGTGLVQWLMDEGNPVVRWRTAAELGPAPAELGTLREDLLAHPDVRRWLRLLGECRRRLHHSGDSALENVGGKLYELGLRAGMEPLDAGMKPWRDRLADYSPTSLEYAGFGGGIVAAVLARLGYRDEAVTAWVRRRMRAIAPAATAMRFDIHIDPDTFGDCPAARRRHPLIDPALCGGDWELGLPLIHDVYAMSALPAGRKGDRSLRDAIVTYILDPRYQALPEGYGNVRLGPRKYYSMGWSVHLPGFRDSPPPSHDAARTVQRVELMAHFAAARKSDWFAGRLEYLDSYRTSDGTWLLPAAYLREAEGYYVLGCHMGLGENRRRRAWRQIESTFRMLKIHRLARA